jgi:hypothetical protein
VWAVALFAATCPYLMIGLGADGDANRFRFDGNAIMDGHFPYRPDFYLEYPPGAIAVFTLPSLVARSHWITFYKLENAVGWALVIVLLSFLTSRRWPLFATALVPLALGSWTLIRMDAWPIACVVGATVAITRGRSTLALALLAVGTMIKSWPIVLLPVFLLYRWSRRALLTFVAVCVATLTPFVILSTVGAYNTFFGQLHRHLQLETIGSSFLLAISRPMHSFFDAGSWNLSGPGADFMAKFQSGLQLAGVLLIAWLFSRSRRTDPDLLLAIMATVTLFAFTGKILSPQYLLWAAPFVSLFPVLVLPYAVACVLTRELFPTHYQGLIELHHGPIALLAVRNAVLVVIVVLVLRSALRLRPVPAHG